tara:strand:- start:420 stop:2006 length:1587 start_codon:yes stop_codon:yes gene_type:complete
MISDNSINKITTENGAPSLSSPGFAEDRLNFFYKCNRNTNTPQLYIYLKKCVKENLLDTFLLVFNLRDCRNGKGERKLGIKCFIWLFINYPNETSKIIHLIPEFGRWDDILYLWPKILDLKLHSVEYISENYNSKLYTDDSIKKLHEIQLSFVKLLGNQLIIDKKNMEEGKKISLCAKWAPSEKDSKNIKYKIVPLLVKCMNWTLKEYRIIYLTPLRKYLNIVEKLMCSNDWENINYNHVPSNAINRLQNAFIKHTSEKFNIWKNSLIYGKNKINSKQLFPHELIIKLKKIEEENPIIEAQWKELEKKYDNFSDCLFLVDVSNSMLNWQWRSKEEVNQLNFTPIDVAIALAILGSNSVKNYFHNHIITFHSKPSFFILPDSSLFERYNMIKNMDWAGSTNLFLVFKLILERATFCNIDPSEMPSRLFILSDMQFDTIEQYSKKTNFEAIKTLYAGTGYNIPKIIFWNLNGDILDFPVHSKENNTALLSGFSMDLINSVFLDVPMNPYEIMRATLDKNEYISIKNAFET